MRRQWRRSGQAKVLPAIAFLLGAPCLAASAPDPGAIGRPPPPAPAVAVPRTFDFETGLPKEARLDNATLTDVPGEVIAGGYSLKCDSRRSGKDWNEFFQTDPSRVRLTPYHRYRVSFAYRILRKNAGSFYYLLRSDSQRARGGGFDQMFWMGGEEGETREVSREFELAGIDDMYLIVGIFGQAVLVIDDVRVEDLGLPGRTRVLPIAPWNPPPYADALAWIRRQGSTQGTWDRMLRMIVVLCNEGAHAKAEPHRMVRDLRPDYIDWNPVGPLGAAYGIRTAASHMEYQGYYRREGPEYWDQRYSLFTNHGFLVTLTDDIQRDETWGEGGYATCQNGRTWFRVFQDRLLRVLDTYEDICQDNLTWSNFNMNGGFCGDCETGFREVLARKYSPPRLAAIGVSDPESFSMRAFLRERPDLRGIASLVDPVVREFIKYQNQSQLAAWCRHVEACKRRGLELGRDVAVYGNQTGIDRYPYAVAVSMFSDAIEVEGHATPYHYLLGRGAGNERKAVFVRGGLTSGGRPNLSVPFWKSRFGLGLTFGGQRVLSLGWNHPETVDPSIPDYIDDPALYAFFRDYSRYLRTQRALYGPKRTLTQLAVIWSYPSMMWRAFMPLDLYPHAQISEFERVGDRLLENHIPFDVLVLGHPELWDDSDTLDRFAEYTDLICPGVDCLSEAQADALADWAARRGHRLWTTGEFATRDQDFNNLESRRRIPHRELKLNEDDLESLRRRAPIVTDAPASLLAVPFMDPGMRWVTVHLFNRRTDTHDGSGPRAPPSRFEVRLPAADYDTVYAVSYEHDRIALEHGFPEPGVVVFESPEVDHYTMVVIANEAGLKKAQTDAARWIEEDRLRVREQMASGADVPRGKPDSGR